MPATQLTTTRKAIRRFGGVVAIALAVASAQRLPDSISPTWKVNLLNYLVQVGVTDFSTVTE